jgi:hypothetical protein
VAKLTNTAQGRRIAIGAASARNGVALEAGQRYLVTASAACHCKQGGSTVTVAVSDAGAFFLAAGAGIVIDCDGAGSDYLACIQAVGAGDLYITCMDGGRD